MFPRITLNTLSEQLREPQNDISNSPPKSSKVSTKIKKDFPIVPPKTEKSVVISLPDFNDETPTWFVVLSPRETKGPTGPFSITQLKQLHKREEISDRTLVWRDGEREWKQLVQQTYLKAQLVSLPPIPPKVHSYNAEVKVFHPYSKVELSEDATFLPLPERHRHSKSCYLCGNVADYHTLEQPRVSLSSSPNSSLSAAAVATLEAQEAATKQQEDQFMEMFKSSQQGSEIGSNEYATEIIPGFLWIGSFNASRPSSIQNLGLTLLINASGILGTINSNPPYFRCKDVALREGQPNFDKKQTIDILQCFENVYDWIEFERLSSERNHLIDRPMKTRELNPITETNQYGLPLKGADDKPFRKMDPDEQGAPFFPPRILLWSKQGTNRSVVLAISYLIKQYGMPLRFVVKFLTSLKPQIDIDDSYMVILKEWSQKYSLGYVICYDCSLMVRKQQGMIEDILKEEEEDDDERNVLAEAKIVRKAEKERDEDDDDFFDGNFETELQHRKKPSKNKKKQPKLKSDKMIEITSEGVIILKKVKSSQPSGPSNKKKGVFNIDATIEELSSIIENLQSNTINKLRNDQGGDITKLTTISLYITPLYKTIFCDSTASYANLLDLNLANLQLLDVTISVLFQLLDSLRIIAHLRNLNLSNNCISSVSIKSLLLTFYPKQNHEPDHPSYLEDDPYFSEDSDDEDNNDGGNDTDSASGVGLGGGSGGKRKGGKGGGKKISQRRVVNLISLDLSHNK
jgi:hypothetical protein